MLGRSHVLLAAASYAALRFRPLPAPLDGLVAPVPVGAAVQNPSVAFAAGLLLVVVASLLPDIDRAGSTIARTFGLPSRLVAWIVQRSFGHRGPLHSGLAVLLVFMLGQALAPSTGVHDVGGPLAFGWATHLVLDSLTARGVPAFWPLRLRMRLPPGLVTGGALEQLLLGLGLATCAVWALNPRA